MTAADYDFRSPPPAELERQVTIWLAEVCRRVGSAWAEHLPYPISFVAQTPALVTGRIALAAVKPDDLAIQFVTPAPAATMWVGLSAPLALGIIAGLLGESTKTAPASRPLSELELPLFDHLAGEMIAPLWAASWPRAGGPAFAIAARGSARELWRPGDDMAVLTRIDATTPFGEYPIYQYLPRSEWAERLVIPTALPRPAADPVDRERIESLVKEMGVDLSVELGLADLTLTELARLRAGDVIVLNQKVSEPLEARVGGSSKFRVWPGAVGSRCAVQVHAVNGRPAAGEAR